jgi:hypothetical protein
MYGRHDPALHRLVHLPAQDDRWLRLDVEAMAVQHTLHVGLGMAVLAVDVYLGSAASSANASKPKISHPSPFNAPRAAARKPFRSPK